MTKDTVLFYLSYLSDVSIPVHLPGMTGNVLINSNANRLSQYYVWSYGPGDESYYRFMYIDFSQARGQVGLYSV